jgi:hypothetical protein
MRGRAATLAPVAEKTLLRTKTPDTTVNRSRRRSTKRRTVQVAAWVSPKIRSELERLAKQEGLSLSRTIRAMLEDGVHRALHVQHALLLEPIIEAAVRREMRSVSNRLGIRPGEAAGGGT